MTVINIPAEIEPHLIGLWKFRQVATKPTWCTTFMIEGKFYDTVGAKTPQRALDLAVKELRKAKRLK